VTNCLINHQTPASLRSALLSAVSIALSSNQPSQTRIPRIRRINLDCRAIRLGDLSFSNRLIMKRPKLNLLLTNCLITPEEVPASRHPQMSTIKKNQKTRLSLQKRQRVTQKVRKKRRSNHGRRSLTAPSATKPKTMASPSDPRKLRWVQAS